MRWVLTLTMLLLTSGALDAVAGSAKIMKVLPHLLDAKGRHALSPSLYERDAYQADLRQHREKCSGLRFDIHWKSTVPHTTLLRLKLEVRGSKEPKALVFEQTVERRPWYKRWSAITMDKETFTRIGEVIAWRASLWDGDRLLAEQRSFLW